MGGGVADVDAEKAVSIEVEAEGGQGGQESGMRPSPQALSMPGFMASMSST
jgi:hypothetical protein